MGNGKNGESAFAGCLRARVQFAQTNNVRCGIVSATCVLLMIMTIVNRMMRQKALSTPLSLGYRTSSTVARLAFSDALAPHITKQRAEQTNR
jgi:hypothetical protein